MSTTAQPPCLPAGLPATEGHSKSPQVLGTGHGRCVHTRSCPSKQLTLQGGIRTTFTRRANQLVSSSLSKNIIQTMLHFFRFFFNHNFATWPITPLLTPPACPTLWRMALFLEGRRSPLAVCIRQVRWSAAGDVLFSVHSAQICPISRTQCDFGQVCRAVRMWLQNQLVYAGNGVFPCCLSCDMQVV